MPTEHILMLSYGKDSLACLGAIKELGWPLDRIIHAEVWATDDIPADLPPMVEFKSHADAWIKENFGIEVEHISAMKDGEKLTFEKLFYHKPKRKKDSRAAALVNAAKEGGAGSPVDKFRDSLTYAYHGATAVSKYDLYGWPLTIGGWCRKLKYGTYLGIPHAQRNVVQQQTQDVCVF